MLSAFRASRAARTREVVFEWNMVGFLGQVMCFNVFEQRIDSPEVSREWVYIYRTRSPLFLHNGEEVMGVAQCVVLCSRIPLR